MGNSLNRLALKRERLVAQAAAQRHALSQDIAPWHKPLARVDQGIVVLGYIRRHPILMIGSMLLLVKTRPHHMGKWLKRGWLAWQVMQNFNRR